MFYGCHGWKGQDAMEFQLWQPLSANDKYVEKFNKNNDSTQRLRKNTPSTVLSMISEFLYNKAFVLAWFSCLDFFESIVNVFRILIYCKKIYCLSYCSRDLIKMWINTCKF